MPWGVKVAFLAHSASQLITSDRNVYRYATNLCKTVAQEIISPLSVENPCAALRLTDDISRPTEMTRVLKSFTDSFAARARSILENNLATEAKTESRRRNLFLSLQLKEPTVKGSFKCELM